MKKIISILIVLSILTICCMSNLNAYCSFNSSDGKKYAVIVVGRYAGRWQDAIPQNFQQYYTWYLNSAGATYSMLKDTYGYTDEDIFLFATLRNRYDIPKTFNPEWIDHESNKENLRNLFYEFKPGGELWIHSNDTLMFIYINHGIDEDETVNGKYAHNTCFAFPYDFSKIRDIISYFISGNNQEDYKLYDWELGEYLENIHAGKMVFLLQPCYSGGFINDLSGINRIICTSSTEDELALESWIEPFIRGLNGIADANGDNRISLLEAYEYAARRVNEQTSSEHPLIDDNDDGIGHHYSEVGYDPTNPNSDGYVAARTYL